MKISLPTAGMLLLHILGLPASLAAQNLPPIPRLGEVQPEAWVAEWIRTGSRTWGPQVDGCSGPTSAGHQLILEFLQPDLDYTRSAQLATLLSGVWPACPSAHPHLRRWYFRQLERWAGQARLHRFIDPLRADRSTETAQFLSAFVRERQFEGDATSRIAAVIAAQGSRDDLRTFYELVGEGLVDVPVITQVSVTEAHERPDVLLSVMRDLAAGPGSVQRNIGAIHSGLTALIRADQDSVVAELAETLNGMRAADSTAIPPGLIALMKRHGLLVSPPGE